MVTAKAIIFGDQEKLLGFNAEEHPIAVQLGGSIPQELADAARVCEDFGYDEINLNVGCPSDRVKSGMFGACMMANPQLVGDCVAAMQEKVRIPVTVKCRIGIDEQDSEKDFSQFITAVAEAGCDIFYVHARKAWLKGLSPKENRTVPPLDYERVYRLKAARPDLEIIINGGINSLEEAQSHKGKIDGVMLGRAAYHNPWILAQLQALYFPETAHTLNREDVLEQLIPYAKKHLDQNEDQQNLSHRAIGKAKIDALSQEQQHGRKQRLHSITRHIMGLYAGQNGARAFRRYMSEEASRPSASIEVLEQALRDIRSGKLNAPL